MMRLLNLAATGMALSVFVRSSFAIVLSPGDTGVSPDLHPPSEVVGRWASNATAVVIDPNHVLTANHPGGSIGTRVTIGGVAYRVAAVTQVGTADLRVCRLVRKNGKDADLSAYVSIYRGRDERDRTIVIGGFGQGRGEPVIEDQRCGFAWDGEDNTTERWGSNRIEATLDHVRGRGYLSALLVATFDNPCSERHVEHEAAIAKGDSGCGWFVHADTGWRLIGIGEATEHDGCTLFNPPDAMAAARLSTYADRIQAICRVDRRSEPANSASMLGFAGDGLPLWLIGWLAAAICGARFMLLRRARS
jgi:hypothetical protein